jgi:hypothetical protein
MSNIADYQALVAAMSVAFTSQDSTAIALTAKDATALQNAWDAADVPVRLLMSAGMSAEMIEPDDTMGPNVAITWTFEDVMLWRHLPLGEGLNDSTYDLREYVTAYMTAAYALEQTGITDRITKDSLIVNTVGQYNFPAGSGEFFTGAVATWTVTEDDPPDE